MISFRKIPFQLGSEILLRSESQPAHKSKSKVVGVLEKEFIMIEDPVFAISDHVTVIVEDDLLVAYVHDGYLFTFKSRFSKKLIRNIICIDYPEEFQVEQLRKETRVRVNLQALMVISDMNISAYVKDISDDGCSFEIPKIMSLFNGAAFTATFTLPNDQLIKDLKCTIISVKYNQIHRKTAVGAKFQGPAEAVSKIRELVRFCMKFKV
jgi:c-di-GMP-binding flagellar brake protein YcgR